MEFSKRFPADTGDTQPSAEGAAVERQATGLIQTASEQPVFGLGCAISGAGRSQSALVDDVMGSFLSAQT